MIVFFRYEKKTANHYKQFFVFLWMRTRKEVIEEDETPRKYRERRIEERYGPVLERRVRRYSFFSPLAFALSWGIIGALLSALFTWAAINGFFLVFAGWMLSLYGPGGYTVSPGGIGIGAVYGFIWFFVIALLFAALYNLFS